MIEYLALTLNKNNTEILYRYFKEGELYYYESSGEFSRSYCRTNRIAYELERDKCEGLTVITDPKEINRILMAEELMK